MKNTLTTILFILTLASAFSQSRTQRNQSYEWNSPQEFNDTLLLNNLTGSGTYLKLLSGRVVKGTSGLGATSLSQDSVIGLVDTIAVLRAGKQDTFVAGYLLSWNNLATRDTLNVDSISLVNLINSLISSGSSRVETSTGLGVRSGGGVDTIYVSGIPQDSVIGLQDSLNALQGALIAGTGITISGDTISASGTDTDWTESGNYVTNTTDSIGIGTASPVKKLDVSGAAVIQNLSSDTALEIFSASGTGITAYSGTGTALAVNAGLAGKGFSLNGYEVDEISNDTLLAGQDSLSLITEYATKKYIDNSDFFIESNDSTLRTKTQYVGLGVGINPSFFTFRTSKSTDRVYNDTSLFVGGGEPDSVKQLQFRNSFVSNNQASSIVLSSRWGNGLSAWSILESHTVASEKTAFTIKTEQTVGAGDNYAIERIRIQQEGVSIPNGAGFTPTERLDVDGNARFRNIGSTASAGALHYDANGVLTTNTSDSTLKKNIEPIQNALEKVLSLNGVMYQWKDTSASQEPKIGLIAQEVELVVPEAAFVNPNTGIMGVHYTDLVALLIEAIKQQEARIKELEAKVGQ